MLGADVVVAELQRLAQRELQHLLGPGRERDVAAGRRAALADDLLDLVADGLEGDAEGFERLGGHPFALVDEPEEDVLCADVVVVQEAGFLLSKDDDSASPVGEPFEQDACLPRGELVDRVYPGGDPAHVRSSVGDYGKVNTSPPAFRPAAPLQAEPRRRYSPPARSPSPFTGASPASAAPPPRPDRKAPSPPTGSAHAVQPPGDRWGHRRPHSLCVPAARRRRLLSAPWLHIRCCGCRRCRGTSSGSTWSCSGPSRPTTTCSPRSPAT